MFSVPKGGVCFCKIVRPQHLTTLVWAMAVARAEAWSHKSMISMQSMQLCFLSAFHTCMFKSLVIQRERDNVTAHGQDTFEHAGDASDAVAQQVRALSDLCRRCT